MPSRKMNIRGITIQINADTEQFAKAFKSISAEMKTARTELKDIEKLMAKNSWKDIASKNGAAVELLTQKQKYLKEEIEQTRSRVELEKSELARLSQADTTPEVERQQDALKRQIIEDTRKLEDLEKEFENFGSVGKQQALIVLNEIGKVGEKISGVGDKMMNFGRDWTFRVTTPIVTAGSSMLNASMDFEQAMAKVQSVTLYATEEQMKELEDAALSMSTQTKFSATEAADALYYMGLAGWDVDMMLTALPNVLDLAAAGDLDLARASDIVTDYITAFKLEAEDATRLVDVMAQTMANSNTNVDQMGTAFKYVAPVAGALGYSIEDISLALGIMANNGIKGSQAGTSLRMWMQRMVNPTAAVQEAMEEFGLTLQDTEGRMLPFKDIMDQMRNALGTTKIPMSELRSELALLDHALEEGEISEEEYADLQNELLEKAYGVTGAERAKTAAVIAGTRAMSGVLAIVNATAEDYEWLADTIDDSSNAAENIADVMMDTAEGASIKLKRSFEELQIEIGRMLVPQFLELVEKGKQLLAWFKNLDDGTKQMIINIAEVAAATGPVILALGAVTKGVGKLISGIAGFGAFTINHPVIAGIGMLAAWIGMVAIDAKAAHDEMIEAQKQAHSLTQDEQELINKVDEMKASYDESKVSREESIKAIDDETVRVQNLVSELQALVDENGFVTLANKERVDYILGELSEATGIELERNGALIRNYQEMAGEIEKVIEQKRINALMSLAEDQYNEAVRNQAEAYAYYTEQTENLADAQADLMEANLQLRAAEQKYNKVQYQNSDISRKARAELEKWTAAQQAAQERVDELTESVKDSSEVYLSYTNDIQNYGEVMNAVASGDVANMTEALNKMTRNFITANNGTKEMLQEQYNSFKTQYTNMKTAVEQGMPGVTQAMVDEMKELVDAALIELSKLPAGGGKAVDELIAEIGSRGTKAEQAASNLATKVTNSLSLRDKMKELGKNYVLGFAAGIRENLNYASNAAKRMAEEVLEQPHVVLGIDSPSKEMMKVGRFFTEGLAIGITDEERTAMQAASSLARNTMNQMGALSASPSVGNVSNTYGAINVTVNGANVQNDEQLANMIAQRINREVYQRRAAYA